MEQRYSIILLFLILSCSKDSIDDVYVTPGIPEPDPVTWTTLSERYSQINETTGFFKAQEYFTGYLSKSYIDINLTINTPTCTYRTFQRNSAVLDLNGDKRQDVIAFANSFCGSEEYGSKPGKLIFISDYKGNALKTVIDIDLNFGGAKMEVNDFDGNGISDALLYSHESKGNYYDEIEGYGDNDLNRGPKKPILIYFDTVLKIRQVGQAGNSHYGTSGDVDNDGDIDFIQLPIPANYNDAPAWTVPSIGKNIGSNYFSVEDLFTDIGNKRVYFTSYELFDLNNDNNLDLIAGWWVGDVKVPTNYKDPIVFWGDGSGKFSFGNSIELHEQTLTLLGYQSAILGFNFTDFDNDNDIDVVMVTTRSESDGSFEDGTYYNNYGLVLFENINNDFIDSSIKISDNVSTAITNFYSLKSIDLDNDGDYDLVPDLWANLGNNVYGDNIFWSNFNGNFTKNN